MTNQQLTLISPTIKLQQSYEEYIEELGDEERYPYPLDLSHDDFPSLIHTLSQYAKGNNLPEWMVTNSTYWLVQNKQIVGCSHLRHTLNDALMEAGGHIGLGIRPAARGKGLGKELLSRTLDKAAALGIQEVHIHCYESNEASSKLIKCFNPSLHSKEQMESGEVLLRFCIKNQINNQPAYDQGSKQTTQDTAN